MQSKSILILGASGMLGNTLFRGLSRCSDFDVYGTVRTDKTSHFFTSNESLRILNNVDVFDSKRLLEVLEEINPNYVINCVGIIKQLDHTSIKSKTIQINSLFPHMLAEACSVRKINLIHFSTDCVFDGLKGNYSDNDLPNARDLYGQSKALGEIDDEYCLTIRTSIIGHEITSQLSLIDWFLAQENTIQGYENAIFSGLPTIYFVDLLRSIIWLDTPLTGIYNVSAKPISKYKLLGLVSKSYQHYIEIIRNVDFVINRSLDSSKFWSAINSECADWNELVEFMHDDYLDVLHRKEML